MHYLVTQNSGYCYSSRLIPEVCVLDLHQSHMGLTFRCLRTFSHIFSHINCSVCNVVSLELQLLCWGWWWPTSPSTGAPLYHAGPLNTWFRLSRVPLTHLGPYLPPSTSLKKQGGEIFYSIFLWFPLPHKYKRWNYLLYLTLAEAEGDPDLLKTPFFTGWFATYSIHSLSPPSVSIKGRMDNIEVREQRGSMPWQKAIEQI